MTGAVVSPPTVEMLESVPLVEPEPEVEVMLSVEVVLETNESSAYTRSASADRRQSERMQSAAARGRPRSMDTWYHPKRLRIDAFVEMTTLYLHALERRDALLDGRMSRK